MLWSWPQVQTRSALQLRLPATLQTQTRESHILKFQSQIGDPVMPHIIEPECLPQPCEACKPPQACKVHVKV